MSQLKAAAISLLLILPACEAVGPMLAGVAIAGASISGEALLKRVGENMEARIMWRLQKREFIQEVTSGILNEARDSRREGNYLSWRIKMDELLEFHEEQRPDLLIVRAAKRLKQLEGEENE